MGTWGRTQLAMRAVGVPAGAVRCCSSTSRWRRELRPGAAVPRSCSVPVPTQQVANITCAVHQREERRQHCVLRARLEDADDLQGGAGEEPDVWKTKPAWCQPWTIVTTGLAIVSSSFLVFHSCVFTGVVAVPIAAWWYIFLAVYPTQYAQLVLQTGAVQSEQAA